MKCIENRLAANYLHEFIEDGGSWIQAENKDAYLCAYFGPSYNIQGEDKHNVSIYGCSITKAVDQYIDSYGDEDTVHLTDKKVEELNLFISVFEQQAKRLKALEICRG